MSKAMNEQDLETLKAQVTKLAKGLKSEGDLNDLTQNIVKMTVEAALGAEMDEHLGYEKHDPAGRGSGNSRNGSTPKKLKGQHGEVEIATPRDRAGTFDPQRGDVGGWLFTICRNKVYGQYRRSGPTEVELLEIDSPRFTPDRTLRLSLQAALGDLRPAERDALKMIYFGGFTYGQAAEQLDVPLGTLKSRLRSALRKLTERLGGAS